MSGLLVAGDGFGASSAPSPAVLSPALLTKLSSLLPQTAQPVTLLTRRSSISTVQLELQVANAGGDPGVLRQIAVSAARGIKPVYDERLNISPEEFRKYVVFQETLVSTGKTFRLAVTRDATRVTFGDGPSMNGVLRGVSVDLKTGEMRSPEGFTARPATVPANDDPNRGLEVKTGFQWRIFGSNATQGRGVNGTLTLLHLSSGRIVLAYKRNSMMDNKINQGELIVDYTRP
ncbi:hypothetical protein [Deinococcus multiflagellatus]|uniref:Uncharacterized protein n=1 Tax=Deinococcus multiflagellatus TaxID=1656887 RepID=A0ABW1ZMW3_9DEIO|nr:hypothetical protein [Deinococcus multiflagellatus]MBZ9713880.1 hypothetical protein [Deinococcus multiflagellatus]